MLATQPSIDTIAVTRTLHSARSLGERYQRQGLFRNWETLA